MRTYIGHAGFSQFELMKKENFCIQVLECEEVFSSSTSNCYPHLRLSGYYSACRSDIPHFYNKLNSLSS